VPARIRERSFQNDLKGEGSGRSLRNRPTLMKLNDLGETAFYADLDGLFCFAITFAMVLRVSF
jgi:hypothetical protein